MSVTLSSFNDNGDILVAVSKTFFGPRCEGRVARALGVKRAQVQAWMSGGVLTPDWVVARLLKHAAQHAASINTAIQDAHRIRTSALITAMLVMPAA